MGETIGSLGDTAKLIGRVFDNRYQIVELIGRGGMSAVYRAVQLSMGKTVAVKVMARSLAEDDKLLQRFNQEALASSRLRHPNTIKVFDYGQSDDGYLFLAMEYLEGHTLGQFIKSEAPVDPKRTCKILWQVCKSLAEAHRAGIVHRDLKPDNVFLSDIYGERDFVKVLDFGIAKFVTEGTQETLTQTGFICGTPLYLSPEQGLGKALDSRTDLYSLGVILYEMLVGQTPFRADSPIGVVMKHIHEPVPPLRQMDPDVVVPRRLEDLVLQLLAKDPEQRPATAEEVGALFEELQAVQMEPHRAPERARARARALEQESHTVIGLPEARGDGKVLSMHANARPTMFLPAETLYAAMEEHAANEADKTTAVPNSWGLDEPDAGQDDRTMMLSTRRMAEEDDPDRTEFLPVAKAGAAAPPAGEFTVMLPVGVVGSDDPHMAASRAPTAGLAEPEAPSRGWMAAAAVVALLGAGAAVYFLTDWLRPSTPVSATEVAAAERPIPSAADVAPAAASLANAVEPARPGAAKEPSPHTEAAPLEAKPAPAAEVAAPDNIAVTIRTTPLNARLYRGSELLGETPHVLTVARSAAAQSLRVSMDGYVDRVVLVDPRLVANAPEVDVRLEAAPPGNVAEPARLVQPKSTVSKKKAGDDTAKPAPAPAPAPEEMAKAATPKAANPGGPAADTREAPKPPESKANEKTPAKPKAQSTGSKPKKPKKKTDGDSMEWKDW